MSPYPSPAPHPACGAALSQGHCPAGGWRGWEGGSWQHCSVLICMFQPFGRLLGCLCPPVCICQLLKEHDLQPTSEQLFVCTAQEARALLLHRLRQDKEVMLPVLFPGTGLSQTDSAHPSLLWSRLPWAGAGRVGQHSCSEGQKKGFCLSMKQQSEGEKTLRIAGDSFSPHPLCSSSPDWPFPTSSFDPQISKCF